MEELIKYVEKRINDIQKQDLCYDYRNSNSLNRDKDTLFGRLCAYEDILIRLKQI